MNYFAGIEAGGTKFKTIVAHDPDHILAETVFPTLDPENTLPKVLGFLSSVQSAHRIQIKAIGLACFGPLDLDRASTTFGWITSTPKLKWRSFPILQYVQENTSLPVKIETDVNAAAIAEGKWGAASGLSYYAYITIGTGIGGGLIYNHKPIFGLSHPEIGHMRINHSPQDPFAGNCPYHTDCLEGLANAPALAARWKTEPSTLADDHPAWDLEAFYLAQMIHNLVMTCSPQKVILGGGVMKRAGLYHKVRDQFKRSFQAYIDLPFLDNLDEFICPPALGDLAGALGAVALVKDVKQYRSSEDQC